MATDWFGDDDSDVPAEADVPGAPLSWSDAEVPVELPEVESEAVAQTHSPRGKGGGRTRWIVGGGVGLLLVVVLGGAFAVASWSQSSSSEGEEVAEASPVTSRVESSEAVEEETSCEQVEADPHDLQGVVVAFQQAYYAGDSDAVEELLAPTSALQSTDWEQVLEVVKESKREVCTLTRVVDDEVVAADVTVRGAGGVQILLQEYQLAKTGDVFQIVEIADRSKK